MNGFAERDYLRPTDDAAQRFEVRVIGTLPHGNDGIDVIASPFAESFSGHALTVTCDRQGKQQ
jgi:hypothetical protein